MKIYKTYKRRFICSYPSRSLFQLNDLSVLIMNNYEISKWQYQYLRIWSLNPVHPYIEYSDFMKYLSIETIGIVDLFFQKFRIFIYLFTKTYNYLNIENRVTVENFLPFLFVFALLPLNKSGRILMSINGIQSNVSLTYQQTCYFFRNLNQNYLLDENVVHWLKKHQNDDNLHLKEVMKIVENSFILCDILYHFQSKIVNIIIGTKCYSEILHRKIYFDTVYDKEKLKSTPKEPFCSKLYRILVLHKPPPYFTSYRLFDTDYNELLAHIQIIIRNMFGYSKRPGQMSEYSYQSERSNSKLVKQTSSYTSTGTTYSYVGKKNNMFVKQNSVIPVSILSLDVPPT